VALVLAPWFARIHGTAADIEAASLMDGVRQMLGALFG
jgi:hypothetical protein